MKVLRCILLMMLALMLLLPCHAQAGDQREVQGVAGKPGQTAVEETVVTATNYETPVSQVPASITIIDREDFARFNLPNTDIGDVLRAVPGITLRRAYSPFPSYLNIRGATSDGTVVLVDSVPTNWEITQAIPVDMIERVEIVRGPGSALYGATATGGVVNIITRNGGDKPEVEVGGGYGSFDTWRAGGKAGGTADPVHLFAAGYKEESDGTNVVHNNANASIHMIDDCPYEKSAASAKAAVDLFNDGKVSLFYNFYHDEYTRGRPYVGGDWDRHFTTLIWDQPFNEWLAFKGYVGYRYDDLTHIYDRGGTNYDLRQKRYTDYSEIPLELQLTADVGWNNKVTAGFFANHHDTEQDFDDATGSYMGTIRYKVQTLAGYLQDVWTPIDGLAVTAGIRYDHWKNYDNHFYNFSDTEPDSRTDDSWNPKIGAKYTFEDTTAIWVNFATGFLPPTPEQLYDDRSSGGSPRIPNPDLKPETTYSWELGVERWFGDSVKGSVAGFYSYTEDKIMSWFGDDNVWRNKNIGRTESYGVEFDVAAKPMENLTLNFNYTWNPVTIDENEADPDKEGNRMPFSPIHKFNIGATYSQPDNFSISVWGRYLGKQHSNDSNTEYSAGGEQLFMDPSFVVDVKATKHFPIGLDYLRGIDLSFSVDNLFDENYRTFYMYEDPGRVFYGEIKIGLM